jgi:hypothetical protein
MHDTTTFFFVLFALYHVYRLFIVILFRAVSLLYIIQMYNRRV